MRKGSLWQKWEELKDECLRRKVKRDILDKFQDLLIEERKRSFDNFERGQNAQRKKDLEEIKNIAKRYLVDWEDNLYADFTKFYNEIVKNLEDKK